MGKNRTRGLVKVSPTFIDRTKCSDPRVRIKFGGASGAKGPSCPEGGQWLFGQGLRSSTCLIHGPLFAELLAGDSNSIRARTKVCSTFRHSMDWMKSGKFRKKMEKFCVIILIIMRLAGHIYLAAIVMSFWAPKISLPLSWQTNVANICQPMDWK